MATPTAVQRAAWVELLSGLQTDDGTVFFAVYEDEPTPFLSAVEGKTIAWVTSPRAVAPDERRHGGMPIREEKTGSGIVMTDWRLHAAVWLNEETAAAAAIVTRVADQIGDAMLRLASEHIYGGVNPPNQGDLHMIGPGGTGEGNTPIRRTAWARTESQRWFLAITIETQLRDSRRWTGAA